MVARYVCAVFTAILINLISLHPSDTPLKLPPDIREEYTSSAPSVTTAQLAPDPRVMGRTEKQPSVSPTDFLPFETLHISTPEPPFQELIDEITGACEGDSTLRQRAVQRILLRQLILLLFIELQTPPHMRSTHMIFFLPQWGIAKEYTATSLTLCAILYFLNNVADFLRTAPFAHNIFLASIIPTIMESYTQLSKRELERCPALATIQNIFDATNTFFSPDPFNPFCPILTVNPHAVEQLLILNTEYLHKKLSTLECGEDVAGEFFWNNRNYVHFFHKHKDIGQRLVDIIDMLEGVSHASFFRKKKAIVFLSKYVDLWIDSVM